MVTVSSITIVNTSRGAMIHMAFFLYIPVNFAFSLPHYVTSYMHHTGKKESKKKRKKEGHEKFASRRFEPGPSECVRIKSERLYPLDHLGKG